MACLLGQSLKRHAPEVDFRVLDFGLTEPHRAFLKRRGYLVTRPADMPPDLHPYAYKASIGDFVRDVEWSNLVWIDADMIAVAPITASLHSLLDEMGKRGADVAATMAGTVANFLENATAGGWNPKPFADAIRARGIDENLGYYSVGFVAFRSRGFLDRWRDLTRSIEQHVCFEQNAFNLLAHAENSALLIELEEWNPWGEWLDKIDAKSDGTFCIGSNRVRFLHLTSLYKEQVAWANGLNFGTGYLPEPFKLVLDPKVQVAQYAVMADFIEESVPDLRETGLL